MFLFQFHQKVQWNKGCDGQLLLEKRDSPPIRQKLLYIARWGAYQSKNGMFFHIF